MENFCYNKSNLTLKLDVLFVIWKKNRNYQTKTIITNYYNLQIIILNNFKVIGGVLLVFLQVDLIQHILILTTLRLNKTQRCYRDMRDES